MKNKKRKKKKIYRSKENKSSFFIDRKQGYWLGAKRKSELNEKMWLEKPGKYPWEFIVTLLIVVIIGLLTLFSASYEYSSYNENGSYTIIRDQVIYASIGIIGMLIASNIDYHFYKKYTWLMFKITVFLLAITPLTCTAINGKKRWLYWPGIPILKELPSIQVSEVAKIVLVIMMATMLQDNLKNIKTLKHGIIHPLIPLVIFAVLISFQSHYSAIIIMCCMSWTICTLSGANLMWCVGGIFIGGGAIWTILQSIGGYVASRLEGWTDDLTLMHNQTKQGLFAIGSGGLTGVGFGNGVEKELWLPECTNDFIFAVYCEEFGFIGAILLIVLFTLLILQIFYVALKAKDTFGIALGVGIGAQIAWQVMFNIAVVTNTVPNTGISLPFFSSGGSSLCMLLFQMGMIISIARYRGKSYNDIENEKHYNGD